MNSELIWVLSMLVGAILLFITNKVRMDVVALLIIILFVLSDTLTLPQALAGFSDPNVILIAALFVVGEGLVRTGIAYQVGDALVKVAGSSETRMLVLLMVAVATLGAVMSSTGVVAIFIPVVLSVANRMGIPAGRLMMPLGFAGLISGMMTLVATPPNMVVNSELMRHDIQGFGFFGFTPMGVIILGMGILYMLLMRTSLVREGEEGKGKQMGRSTMRDLIRDYRLAGRARRLAIRPDSPLIGQTLDELQLRARFGANVIGMERWRKFRRVMVSVTGVTEFQAKDVLLIDMSDPEVDVREFCSEARLEPMILRGEYFSDQAREVGMAEVSLIPGSRLLGKSIREVTFRSRYGLSVVGIRRDGEVLTGKLVDEALQMGDTLLVVGNWSLIRQLQTHHRDFLLLGLPAEVDEMAPARSQAIHALIALGVMIVLMVTDPVPNVIAALIACLLMGKFRCIDLESAYKSIHWPTLILIVGMLPFALALQQTGGVDLIVGALISAVGEMGPRVMLASLFVLCAVIGLFISNTATAVLMAPIALGTAHQMGVSPYPFAMTIAIAASAAFMTPVSSPVNTLVLGPGNYKFMDFVRIGVPFTALVMVVSVIAIPWFFPF
ncbi:SLC13 family permease [Aeromonas caviae]|uniref:SLC13 family permease n=1 Tax=Aeromonas caviae TaxID=648 RepID=A0AAV4YJY7_AERCA|nr:SLC13 family permease [Aeromonas caviae]MEA9427413.1 SLC13 family permease [Aeromonas caviae]MEA9432020.1 SLC13 family permease [Aeromonas caviae]MEA9436010.1 SLC13 family permease [Aeromonas caviae]WEE23007.1 SLC13 family permease [Aeromonas caviae]GJA32326.1 SLC13 family permease [Aeromonas caviae]